MQMRLDWYDRSTLCFVLDGGLASATPRNPGTPVQFGISAGRIAQRFEAVVDLYTSQKLPLEEADRDLVRRAACHREGGGEVRTFQCDPSTS